MKRLVIFLFCILLLISITSSLENLDELEARTSRRTTNNFYSGEDAGNNYIWQPQTLCYTDVTTGHEVWVLSSTDDATALSGGEYGHQPWSADGKRLAIAIDKDSSAFTRGSYYANEVWFTSRSDGSYLRPRIEAPARIRTHNGYTHWSPTIPNVYYAFGRNYAGEGASAGELYKITVLDNSVISENWLTFATSERYLPKDAITSDGKYVVANVFSESTYVSIGTVEPTPTLPVALTDYDIDRNLDPYWGDTPSSYTRWHDEMFVGAGNNYWIYFLPSGSGTWWRMRPWGTNNNAPNHVADISSPYDWWEGTDDQKEIQPLNARTGTVPDFAGNYWSHAVPDRWGTHIAYSDTEGSHVAPGVWDVENSVRTAFPSEAKQAQYHAWTGWTDYTTGTTGGEDQIYYMNYKDGNNFNIVSTMHATTGGQFTKPGQSPDGTKTAYRSDFLQPTSTNGNVFFVVTEFPYPPEITQTSASSGTVTIRFDWRLATTPRSYTTRGWPDPDVDDPSPPREIEKFRLWRSNDGNNWIPVNTGNYYIFNKYDFSDGTWSGNDYWTITDSPGDGTWYYAVTSKEWSGLESRTLSNVYRITLSGGSGTGSQSAVYPSSPGDIDNPKTSDFYTSFSSSYAELIRYYNIYAEDGSTPTVDQTNRIASIPIGACAGGSCSWVDWLGSTSGNTNYVVTPVDTQGNEGSTQTITVTHQRPPATANGQYTIEWDGPVNSCGTNGCEPSLGENCQTCPADCPTLSGQVCCSGIIYIGDCCSNIDCSGNDICTNHICSLQSNCTEFWTCTNWTACTDNQQTRICTDQNNCGTTNNKPNETQACEPQFNTDLDNDGDVDLNDFEILNTRYGTTYSLMELTLLGKDFGNSNPTQDNGLIINHNSVSEFDSIPQTYIDQAKQNFKISYGHTSHGSQIVTGMDIVENEHGSLYSYSSSSSSCSFNGVFLCDRYPSGDLGNPDRTTWAQRTRDMLDNPNNDRNFVIWSWCGQHDTSSENIDLYLDTMNQLEEDYPDITFIYMTGHLNSGSGPPNGNTFLRNEQIRNFAINNDKNLFDFADIESYDPDGTDYRNDDDACNWCSDWCSSHSCPSCSSCAHSHCFNCYQKGKAFWVMMAKLSGWD